MLRPALLALLLALPLLAGCTTTSDADKDDLDDTTETTPYEIRVQTREGAQLRQVTSDPAVRDTDGDGLSDGDEVDARTDPGDFDTDADGLLDGHDLLLHEPDPRIALFAARGIVRDPLDGRFLGEAEAGSKPFEWDSDRPFPDGLSDGDELRGWNVSLASGTRFVRSDPRLPDTDKDNLNDLEESLRGCDPTAPDADLDRVPDPFDADCAHDVQVSIAVGRLVLNRSLDPAGDTDLLIVAQAAGLQQNHTQAIRLGPNDIAFRWVFDVPDHGAHLRLRVPIALSFYDVDFVGDDPQSGVDKQPLCVVAAQGACHTLLLDLDVFTRRFAPAAGSEGPSGTGGAEASGPDGRVTFSLQPLLR